MLCRATNFSRFHSIPTMAANQKKTVFNGAVNYDEPYVHRLAAILPHEKGDTGSLKRGKG